MSHFTVAVFTDECGDVDGLLAPYQENNMGNCPQEFMEFYEHPEGNWDDDRQAYGYWENPNAKWDWYEEGGRWSNLLKLKTGELCNSARVGDIDFSPDDESYKSYLRFWEVFVDGDPLKPGENEQKFFSFYKPEYYLDKYKTKETYAKIESCFATYAVITPDGEWHAPGDMGWWGISTESNQEGFDWQTKYKERFIDTADPEWTLTIVDCHI